MAKKILLFITLLIIVFVVFTAPVLAQEKTLKFQPQVEIPGSKFKPGQEIAVSETSFANYLKAFFDWSIRAILIIGVVMIMVGGFQWMTAAGNAPKLGQAKARIISALIGIGLAIGSFTILNFISPSLTRLEGIRLGKPIAKETLEKCTSSALENARKTDVDACTKAFPDYIKGPIDVPLTDIGPRCYDPGKECYEVFKKQAPPGWECEKGYCPGAADICCVKFVCGILVEEECEKRPDCALPFGQWERGNCKERQYVIIDEILVNITSTTEVKQLSLYAKYYKYDDVGKRSYWTDDPTLGAGGLWAGLGTGAKKSEKIEGTYIKKYTYVYSIKVSPKSHSEADFTKDFHGVLWIEIEDPDGWPERSDKYCVGENNSAVKTNVCMTNELSSATPFSLKAPYGESTTLELEVDATKYPGD